MSGTSSSDTSDTLSALSPSSNSTSGSTSGAAVGGGGSGGNSVGGSTSGLTTPADASSADTSDTFLADLNLPPQYSTANTGFYTRQTESVPTSVTVGPDGALYVGVLSALPYPAGYAYVARIANPDATTGYNGTTPSGVPQIVASGLSEVESIAFNNTTGDMYVLEYLNSAGVYDPTVNPADLPPSQLIQIAPDGTRTTISGPELHLGEYITVNQQTGDIYAEVNNDGPGTGQVLDYHQDPTTGQWNSTVIASGLNGPRGMAIGPDGNLYVLESGDGTPANSPQAGSAPTIPFQPGTVSERFGYSGSITRVDLNSAGQPTGTQERVLTGLPSFLEYNPTTGQDRVNAIGANALTITPDGTVYIASGGGLAPETAQALGSAAADLQGILQVNGLFGGDGSQVTVTPKFNALQYATQNGPDGSTTLFNTESNLYDITQGPNGQLYTVDAARNVLYGLSSDGSTVDSVTVLQKQPPVLTDPQYAATVAAGGDPSEQYAAEISNVTYKGAGQVPNVPGNIPSITAGNEGLTTSTSSATSDTASALPSGSSSPTTGSTSDTSSALPTTAATGSTTGSTSDTSSALPAGTNPGGPLIPASDTSSTLPTGTATGSSGSSAASSDTAGVLTGTIGSSGAVIVAPVGTTLDASSTLPTSTSGAIGTVLPADSASTLPSSTVSASTSDTASTIVARGEDAQEAATLAADSSSSLPTLPSGATSSGSAPPDSSSGLPTIPTDTSSPFPGATDPTSPPVLADNTYANYFNPFFGNYSPGQQVFLPTGNGGTYSVSKLIVFGDRLADNGNATALEQSLGQAPGNTAAPYSATGDFSDGPKWTTDLAQELNLALPSQQANFAYESATAQNLGVPNPFDPDASLTPLDTFAGQIQQYEQQDGTVDPNALVSITFGGNDISLPGTGTPDQAVTGAVNAIISGMDQLASDGAKHFLVSNLPDITLAPLFNSAAFQQATGATPAEFQGLVSSFNSQLSSALSTFQQQQPGVQVTTLNLNSLFNSIAADPSDFGFSNVSQSVLSSTPTVGSTPVYNPAIVGQNPTVEHSTLFLDQYFDPTALGQTIMAQAARSTLTA